MGSIDCYCFMNKPLSKIGAVQVVAKQWHGPGNVAAHAVRDYIELCGCNRDMRGIAVISHPEALKPSRHLREYIGCIVGKSQRISLELFQSIFKINRIGLR